MNIKNKLSSLMYAPLALALLAACSSDEDFSEKTPEVKGQTLIINATNGIEANSSRTIFTDEETKVKAVWGGTDNVVVVNGTSSNVSAPANFTVTPKEDAHYATLTGTVTGLTAGNVVSGYIVSDYIKAENLSNSNQLVSVDYSKQKGTFADAMAHCLQFGTATYTEGENISNMSFYYKTTFFELTLTFPASLSSTVQLSMSGNGLVGKSYVNTVANAGEYNTDANIEGNINISDVNVEAGKAKVWVAMQPATLSNVVITAVDANNKYYKFDVSGKNSANLVAGKVYAFGVTGTASTIEESLIGNGKNEANAYQISTLKQLEFVRDQVNNGFYSGKYYKLMSDIEINGEWKPIGTNSNQFKGHFDGANHTVSGSYTVTNLAGNEGAGLFGVASSTTIKNLHNAANITVTASALTCGIGSVVGRLLYGSTLEHCSNTGTITASDGHVGGIVGSVIVSGRNASKINTALVEACWNDGHITSNSIRTNSKGAGGVIGILQTGTGVVDNIIVRGCYSKTNAEISITTKSASYGGGVVGFTGNTIDDLIKVYACWSAASFAGNTNTKSAIISAGSNAKFSVYDTWRKDYASSIKVSNVAGNITGNNNADKTDTPSAEAITYMNNALSTAGSAYKFDANGNITK